jgi:ABC-type sugar transport system permease subunit
MSLTKRLLGKGESTTLGVRSRRSWYYYQRRIAPYVFISPFYLLFVVFSLGPLIAALYFSVVKWTGTGPRVFVGLGNYLSLIRDDVFLKSFYNTVYYTAVNVLVLLPFALLLALITQSTLIRLKGVFRVGFVLPILTSTVAASLMFGMMFNRQFGLLNYLLEQFGLPAVHWLGQDMLKNSVLMVIGWRYSGMNMLYFVAGLQSIPVEVYEAAAVDGAGRWTSFWRITLPLLRPVILFVVVMAVIGSFQMFVEPSIVAEGSFSAASGGPNNAGLSLAMYLYRSGFQFARLGYASAIGYVLALIIFVATLIQFKVLGTSRGY